MILIFLYACRSEKPTQETLTVQIRIPEDPGMLHPMLSRSSWSTQIEGKIFMPLQDYNPQSLNFEPLLLQGKPQVEVLDSLVKFSLVLKNNATWADGQPITFHDYLFTLKSAVLPPVGSPWAGLLSQITHFEFDAASPNEIEVFVKGDYLLGEQIVTNFAIYPEHIYDSLQVLRNFELADIYDFINLAEDQKNRLQSYAEGFRMNSGVGGMAWGAGAYVQKEYVKDRYIILERVDDWWGDAYEKEGELFLAIPTSLNYTVMTDEFTALNAMKQGSMDIMSEIPPKDFLELKNDTAYTNQFDFLTPSTLQNYIVAINNAHPFLSDLAVRKSLAHAINTDQIVEQLFYSQAQRSVGPVHPQKSFFNTDLKLVDYSPEKAAQILEEGGWFVGDDGIRYKEIEGKRAPLHLTIMTSNRQLGQDFAAVISSQLLAVGISNEVLSIETRELIKNARAKNYDLALIALKQNPGWEDPYPFWHSNSDHPGGNNFFAYHSTISDSLIDLIRSTRDEELLTKYFKEFQQVIYADQPAVFLVNPQERVIAKKSLRVKPSVLRPGYFENGFGK